MNPIDFACFFERFQKSVGYQIDQDIVGKIYDYYEGSYENYTLLELISMLSVKDISIDCAFNKKAIIQMIHDKQIDIPKRYENVESTIWWIEEGKRYNYIFIPKTYFAFYEGDVFETQAGIVWKLVDIDFEKNEYVDELESINEEADELHSIDDNYVAYMYFINQDTGDDICISVEDFMYSLDYDDITILYSNNMRLKNIMSYEYVVYE
jgi:hypothetical protein